MPEEARPKATLRQWRLKNFKSIREATLDFAPLTLLVGENSSGKSSVLQSIRFVVQSVRDRSGYGGLLPLNGHEISLGTMGEVRSSWSRGGKVWFGGVVDVEGLPVLASTASTVEGWDESPRTMREETDARRRARIWSSSWFQFDVSLAGFGRRPQSLAVVDRARFTLGPAARQEREGESLTLELHSQEFGEASLAWASRLMVADMPKKFPVRTYHGEITDSVSAHEFLRVSSVGLEGPFPAVLFVPEPGLSEAIGLWLDGLKGPTPPDDALDPGPLDGDLCGGVVSGLVNVAEHWWQLMSATVADRPEEEREGMALSLFVMSADKTVTPEEAKAVIWRYPDAVKSVILKMLGARGYSTETEVDVDAGGGAAIITGPARSISGYFSTRVHYLGPLREDPHTAYKWPPSVGAQSLGAKGEYTAAALLFRTALADDVARVPDALPLPDDSAEAPTLHEAVESWLRFFRVARGLKVEDSPLGPVIMVTERDGRDRNLTQVGVGVSQLLPVIVQCLVAKPGSIVMLEQPELHLHPALQQKLGDFLLACAESGRQLIVETHSEHLVTRLRRRIAGAADDHLLGMVQILFAEKSEKGETRFRAVKPNLYGGIDDWPKGFFDESAEESREILRAAAEKHRSSQARDGKAKGSRQKPSGTTG